MNLRQQKKHETRLRIQDAAFRLAEQRGFAGATVEDIAGAARVSPSTVYRYFGTKEGIFVWDELELPAVELIRSELERRPPLEGALAALISLSDLGFHVPEDEMRRRVRFLHAEPALQAAMREALEGFGGRLSGLFVEAGTDPLASRMLSGITMSVVTAAIEEWAFADPPVSLAEATEHARASLDLILSR